MISVAYASEAAGAAHGAFYEDPAFLVAVAFVITIALIGKTVFQKISAALDERSEGIRTEIEEATRLRRTCWLRMNASNATPPVKPGSLPKEPKAKPITWPKRQPGTWKP